MSTTLTNGLKLPDKGSVDWYADMQSNYTILDGAVGTIAEHTSALSDKAPLVHTHTKSDITDFPAYGNTAGTICEGNDSRLFDARTPVAHTHTKSDVTDLFNSANTWSAKNTFSADCIIYNSDDSGSVAGLKLRNSKAEILSTGNTSSDQAMTFRDKNDVAISYIRGAVQSNGVALKIGAYAKDSSNNTVNTELQLLAYSNGNKAIFPSTTNAYDLGSSSYQWNNLYAKNYYYNGTAWGLNKANVWSAENTYTASNVFRKRPFTLGDKSSQIVRTEYKDTNNARWGIIAFAHNTDNSVYCDIGVNCLKNDGQTVLNKSIRLSIQPDNNSEFKPMNDQAIHLGTSIFRWKTLNGINPGALSLPNQDVGSINLSGNITVLDGSASNDLTQTVNGWLFIYIENTTGAYIRCYVGSGSGTRAIIRGVVDAEQSQIYVFVPIYANITVSLYVKATSISRARFYPCLGNV